MSHSHRHRKPKRSEKETSSSSSSSSTTEEETVTRVVTKVEKRHKKRDSSSSSSGSGDRKKHSGGRKKHEKHKDSKHKKHKESSSGSSSEHSESRSRSRSKGRSSSSEEEKRLPSSDSSSSWCSCEEGSASSFSSYSSSSSCSGDEEEHKGCCRKEWVCELKEHLLKDPALMAAGCDAFGAFYGTTAQAVPLAGPVLFGNVQLAYNVDLDASKGAMYVRKEGVYHISFMVTPDQSSQWTLFVGEEPVVSKGTSSGAGTMLMFKTLDLPRNAKLSIRNFSSGVGTVNIITSVGGTLPGNNTELRIVKIAPSKAFDPCSRPTKMHLCRKTKKEFKKALRCLEKDPQLMLKGSDVFAAAWAQGGQDVAVDAPVLYGFSGALKCVDFTPGTGVLKVKEAGIYEVVFFTETVTASQFAVAINGVAFAPSITGANRGSSVVVIRDILTLNAGDMVSITNHISSAGAVTIVPAPGGSAVGNSASFVLVKLAPPPALLCPPVPADCWENKELAAKNNCDARKCSCCAGKKQCEGCKKESGTYRKFKNFLLRSRHLEIDGASSYIHTAGTQVYDYAPEQDTVLGITQASRRACHTPGTAWHGVGKKGTYMALFDIETVQAAQFAFANKDGVIEGTTSGTNSGANEMNIVQLLSLAKGEQISARNHTSFAASVQTQLNPGGTLVAENTNLVLWRIAPTCWRRCDRKAEVKAAKKL